MKSAYELAMERLNKTAPSVKLTAKQKKQIADLESEYKARIADREIAIEGEISQAEEREDPGTAETLRGRLIADRKTLQAELEVKKEKIREAAR